MFTRTNILIRRFSKMFSYREKETD